MGPTSVVLSRPFWRLLLENGEYGKDRITQRTIYKIRIMWILIRDHLDSLLRTTRGWENRTRCVTAPQRLTTRKRGVWVIEEIRR